MVLFASSEGLCERGRCACQHVPPENIPVSSYEQADRIILSFLPKLSQVLCSGGERDTPFVRAYFLRRRESYSLHSGIFPQSPQDQLGDWGSLVGLVILDVKTDMLGLLVINVKRNIANRSAARSAIGHFIGRFGQEVSKIKLSPNMSNKRFTHGNRFTDCMVAN